MRYAQGVIPHPVPRVFLVLACAALIASPYLARAGRPQPASETKALHISSALGVMAYENDFPGCAIWEAFQQAGVVNLQAVLRGGTASCAIGVSVSGYAAGVYTVSAVTASSATSVVLGTLRVRSTGTSAVTGTSPGIVTMEAKPTVGYARFAGAGSALPGGLNPFDIAAVTLSSTGGDASPVMAGAPSIVPILGGNPTASLNPAPDVGSWSAGGEQSFFLIDGVPIPHSHYDVISPLASGTLAPGASGFALIRATWGRLPLSGAALNFPVSGHLTIHAQGLPASTTLTYAADGADLGSAATDAVGKLNILASQGANGTLPPGLDLFAVKTVTVHDASGNVLVSAGF